ncbi:hypothetical protein PLANPX_4034 [Lacipirellula parvula]|uniref:Uncharacterized protein n=1 Tax=Lacipirellula parvula TaxID=2650471 RepID=A0A5K7XEH7_9BACT|nr:hypothetical protein PLANPX_4034 [Lacipirellula parvula]
MAEEEDNDQLFRLLELAQQGVRPSELLESHPKIAELLRGTCGPEVGCIFGSLLLNPALQSNCVRLEALVHLAVGLGRGTSLLKQDEIASCFNDLEHGECGQLEDPAEDVFVSLALTKRGNFRVLEGIWESGTFYLQRVLEIVDKMPGEGAFAQLRRSIDALLTLSEAVCQRAGLERHSIGFPFPKASIPKKCWSAAKRRIVQFDEAALTGLGITRADLEPFILEDELLPHVLNSPLLGTPLQRFPVTCVGKSVALVLPTAVSFAIRAAVVDFAMAFDLQEAFVANLVSIYQRLFSSTYLIGMRDRAPVPFTRKEGVPKAEAIAQATRGHFTHYLFLIDTLQQVRDTGVAGADPSSTLYGELISSRIAAAAQQCKQDPDFKRGVTLVVHCGVGRSCDFILREDVPEGWDLHGISAADLLTLSHCHGMSPVKFLKVLDSIDRLRRAGVELFNDNGLLNLFGWVDANDGHAIRHDLVPPSFRANGGVLQIAPSFVKDLRHKVALRSGRIAVSTVEGQMRNVEKLHDSFFDDDNDAPIYAGRQFTPESGIPFVYVSKTSTWWCHVIPTLESDGLDYERWLMLKTWVQRIVPILDRLLEKCMPPVLLLEVGFHAGDHVDITAPPPTRSEIEADISIATQQDKAITRIVVGQAFDRGLAQATNVAERALVAVICSAIAELCGTSFTKTEASEIESMVVGSDDARHMHSFQARTFREFVSSDLSAEPEFVDEHDSASIRLGLAFRVEKREGGRGSLRTKRQCTTFLNKLVTSLECELCDMLAGLDRAYVVESALRNHERAQVARKRWARTSRANIGLHGDKESTLRVIVEHDLKLSSAILVSLVLTEVATCECRAIGGRKPNRLETDRAMALVDAIWQLGGWSDAIHLDAMRPSLTITPLGDVHAYTEFQKNVAMPFAVRASEDRIDAASADYEEYFLPSLPSGESLRLDSEFLDAWSVEFGFDLESLRHFLDAIEDIGVERQKAVYQITKSELCESITTRMPLSAMDAILSAFSFVPRTRWKEIPYGCDARDVQAWKFRRRLSVVRRPVIQLDNSAHPSLLIAPGLVRDMVAYVVDGYFERSFPDSHTVSGQMRMWQAKRVNVRGSRFAEQVAERICERGWQIKKIELQVKEILARGTDPEFGDLRRFGDVDVLCWNAEAKRVLIIECKHLQHHKTSGELAEQLSDYRGQIKNDGRPDDLRKHLNRVELLKARKDVLLGSLFMPPDSRIEGWIIFRNPVPMLYAWHNVSNELRMATFDDIDQILI